MAEDFPALVDRLIFQATINAISGADPEREW